MMAPHALLALMLAVNITPVEKYQQKALLPQKPIERNKESLRPRYPDFLLPFKEGYIKEEEPVLVKPPKQKPLDLELRKCHRDVNFFGKSKHKGKPNLRACGRK